MAKLKLSIPQDAAFIHPTAIVEQGVSLGADVKIWHFCHVRKNAKLGESVSLGRDVFIDESVEIGAHSRLQNGVSVYHGVHIAEWVFVGPHVIFTNDLTPRVGQKNWTVVPSYLKRGCSLGAGTVIRCGITVGAFAMTGSGSIVTHDLAPFTLAYGSPARAKMRICACGVTQSELVSLTFNPICPQCEKNLPPTLIEIAKIEFSKTVLANGLNGK